MPSSLSLPTHVGTSLRAMVTRNRRNRVRADVMPDCVRVDAMANCVRADAITDRSKINWGIADGEECYKQLITLIIPIFI